MLLLAAATPPTLASVIAEDHPLEEEAEVGARLPVMDDADDVDHLDSLPWSASLHDSDSDDEDIFHDVDTWDSDSDTESQDGLTGFL